MKGHLHHSPTPSAVVVEFLAARERRRARERSELAEAVGKQETRLRDPAPLWRRALLAPKESR